MIVGSALFHSLISLFVLLVVLVLAHGGLPYTVLYAPIVFFPIVPATLGFAWILTSLGVFARDIKQVIGVMMTILLFLSPVFYPISAVPPAFRPWLMANPLTFIIEQSRSVLFFGNDPDWSGLAVYTSFGVVVALLGYAWFQKTRKGFADVVRVPVDPHRAIVEVLSDLRAAP